MSQYQNLLAQGNIGSLSLRNRIIMAPMGSNLSEADGCCGERIIRYYEARAKGGAAMVTVGVASVAWPNGACNPNQVAISQDQFIPGLSALVDAVHQHGCKAAIQLQHAGKVAVCDIEAGREMLVPSIPTTPKSTDMIPAMSKDEMALFLSGYSQPGAQVKYKVATLEDIQWLINCFADAAERAVKAGFDGIELHAGHGYILSEFISPYVNQRTDEYGGSVENRARLLAEVIAAVKLRISQVTDKGIPVWCRLDAKEFRIDGGISLETAKQTAQIAEAAGADAIHVSAYADSASGVAFTDAPLVHQPMGFVDFAKAIKQQISVPVIAVGRIEPEQAERLIKQGHIDFVAMARKMLADPDLPNKLIANKPADIRPCIYCYTCVSEIFIKKPVQCAVNVMTGSEYKTAIENAEQPKSIMVIGGGPAGMEAARVACLRGHQVSLFERSLRLGGTVFFSSLAYAENARLIEYLEQQVRQMPIHLHLQTDVDAATIQQKQPDAIIVATGALRRAPAIKGADLKHVFNGDELRDLLTGSGNAQSKLSVFESLMLSVGKLLGFTRSAKQLRSLSHWWMPLGKKVTIIGGGLVGVELAEFLVERGRQVCILEPSDKFALELPMVRRWRILDTLKQHHVEMVSQANVLSIDSAQVYYHIADTQHSTAADSVIFASGAMANRTLVEQLADTNIPIIEAGDCSGISYIHGAMHEGAKAGMEV